MRNTSGKICLSASGDDKRAVQGKWLMIRYESDGMVSKSPLTRLPRHLLLIAGNSFERALPGRSPTDVGTFVLDAGTIPGTITCVTTIGQKAGSPLRGIYDLLRDRLVLGTSDPFQAATDRVSRRPRQHLFAFIHA